MRTADAAPSVGECQSTRFYSKMGLLVVPSWYLNPRKEMSLTQVPKFCLERNFQLKRLTVHIGSEVNPSQSVTALPKKRKTCNRKFFGVRSQLRDRCHADLLERVN